ncbi:MAG: hypothetical protein U0931_41220 [Vulcanimicrobiota bacterium]
MKSLVSGAKPKLDQHRAAEIGAIWTPNCELGGEREAGLQIEIIHQNIEKRPQFPQHLPVYQDSMATKTLESSSLPQTKWPTVLKPATTSWFCPSSTPSAISSSK